MEKLEDLRREIETKAEAMPPNLIRALLWYAQDLQEAEKNTIKDK